MTDVVAGAEPFAELGLRGRRVLVVASTGGHLAQAVRLWDLAGFDAGSRIVTFRSPQSERLTSDRPVSFVPYVAPRDVKGVARARRTIRRLLRTGGFEVALST
ncbi:MAG: hypothetical protein QM655_17155, partial [Nocardioidaceae bacterium]